MRNRTAARDARVPETSHRDNERPAAEVRSGATLTGDTLRRFIRDG